MNFFYIINGKKLKQYAVIILTALVSAWFLYIQNISLQVFSTDNGPKALYKGKNGVALTFNISWGDTRAVPIIDLLVEKNVKSATFFLSGAWAEQHPHIVEKIAGAGFEIGLLGYEYLDYEEIDDDEIRRDILKAEEVFKKLISNIKKLPVLQTATLTNGLLKLPTSSVILLFIGALTQKIGKAQALKKLFKTYPK